jgi:hypothetical protein
MHLRMVIYRCKSTDERKTYGFLCVSFGDVAAQAILECCLKRLAKTYKEYDLIAALMEEIDRFVNDLPSGSDFREIIERLRGEVLDNWQTTGSVAALFAMGGFLLKVVSCSGDENGPMDQKLGGAILGIKWDTEADKFSVPLTVNVSKRRRGETTGPDVTDMCIEDIEAAVITRRIALSITMSPLDYICPQL